MHNFFGASRFLNWTKGSEVNDQSPKNSSKKKPSKYIKKEKTPSSVHRQILFTQTIICYLFVSYKSAINLTRIIIR